MTIAAPATAATLRSAILSSGVHADLVDVRVVVDAAGPDSGQDPRAPRIRELATRVRSALAAVECEAPRRLAVSTSSGQVTPGAASLDLAVALGVLVARGDVPAAALDRVVIVGELGLDGSIRAVRGVLSMAERARAAGAAGIVVPDACAWEAWVAAGAASAPGLPGDLAVYPVSHLRDLVAALREGRALARCGDLAVPTTRQPSSDMADVRGLPEVVDQVAAAVTAWRGVLLVGPPGAGRTMIARRATTLLPGLTAAEAVDVTRTYSALGMAGGLCVSRPFRAPHYTVSSAALSGQAHGRPGEAQLAQHGVLFLDQLDEFRGSAVADLAAAIAAMPAAARPLVVAAAQPCPCGWAGSAVRACACSAEAVERHRARVEALGAVLGIADVVEFPTPTLDQLRAPDGASSAELRLRHASIRAGVAS